MTPKEKAKELVDKFSTVGLQQREEGLECALICLDYMKEALSKMDYGMQYLMNLEYLIEVEQEIENMIFHEN
jgi:hypothetical protein